MIFPPSTTSVVRPVNVPACQVSVRTMPWMPALIRVKPTPTGRLLNRLA